MNHQYNDQTIYRSLENAEYPYYFPADQMVDDVTPWRQSMRYILLGWLLSAAAIETNILAYYFPVIGGALLYLGFRTLKKENRWLNAGLILSLGLGVWSLLRFAASRTIWFTAISDTFLYGIADHTSQSVTLAILICLHQGIRQVQKNAGADPDTRYILASGGLYVVIFMLPRLGTTDLFILLNLVAVAALAFCLYKAYKHIGEAGYAIQSAPVRLRKLFVWLITAGLVLLCVVVGLLFFQQYPMQWQTEQPVSVENLTVRSKLAELGMPEQILADLSEEDAQSLAGAEQIQVGKDFSYENNPKMTTVAIQIGDDWKVIHHFQWLDTPFYRGTECLKLNYDTIYKDHTGRVLWDDGETVQSAPFYLLERIDRISYYYADNTVDSVWPAVYAAFSFPLGAKNCRGYVLYDCGRHSPGNGQFPYYYQEMPIILMNAQDVVTYYTTGRDKGISSYFAVRYAGIQFVD